MINGIVFDADIEPIKLFDKKKYQTKIILARQRLSEGKVIQAYDMLGEILIDMEK